MVNDNPDLLDGFATDENSLTEDIPALLSSLGWSLTNSKINGKQLNTIFNQLFGYLNFLQSKGLSFWQNDKPYVATASYKDIVRRGNKIYYAKQNSNPDPVNNPAPKAPESNPTYWRVLLDLDNPPTFENFSNYFIKNNTNEVISKSDNDVFTFQVINGGGACKAFNIKGGSPLSSDAILLKTMSLDNTKFPFIVYGDRVETFGKKIATLDDFQALISKNGYQKLSSGLILQWFRISHTLGKNTAQTFNFPLAFPNGALSLHITDFSSVDSKPIIWSVDSSTSTSFNTHWTFGDVISNNEIRSAYIYVIGY